MSLRKLVIVMLSLMIMAPVYAADGMEEKVGRVYDFSGSRTEQIGLTIRYKLKTEPEVFFKGIHVPVRVLFAKVDADINWGHTSKVATIKKKGKRLVITQNKNYAPSEDEVLWPREWAIVEDGMTKISLPYLAYIFDRYAKHSEGAEASKWKEALLFLGIEHMDNLDSSPKDKTLHSFVTFK
ncbi:stalk domain-containing protein [Paenibacillus plantiphilus]|uniref:stalk domain-containing protein n=1 Tax=Paenibacillus plantiphilus TaxID=2905650 RepID=UPI001F31558D|nr:stalk domain-containing protein [Paenibacillus plantiphilus]